MPKILPVQGEDGVFMFDCPGCQCGHAIWTTVPNDIGARWSFDGNLERPTISPSVLVFSEDQKGSRHTKCHSFVRDGKIEFLTDCVHELAGKMVELPDLLEDP